jgi:uncharacterized metal-binding protein YceD (DUF177 family)
MKLFLREISEEELELRYTQAEAWVRDAVRSLDEETYEERRRNQVRSPKAAPAPTKDTPIDVSFAARVVDDVYLVDGHLKATVRLCCSRCATGFALESNDSFSVLFSKDPVVAGLVSDEKELHKKTHVSRGRAFSGREFDVMTDPKAHDSEITFLEEDFINLADVITEQLQLRIPFQPLCKIDCKGMCGTCGTDWNFGRCACKKVSGEKEDTSPFSVLKDLKIDDKNRNE